MTSTLINSKLFLYQRGNSIDPLHTVEGDCGEISKTVEMRQIVSVSLTYFCFQFEVLSLASDLACAVARLEFLDHLTGLSGVLELIEALFTIDILFNGSCKDEK